MRGSILEKKSGLCEANNEIEHTSSSRQRAKALHDFSPKDNALFTPEFYFIVGIIFNLCLLGLFKYTDFLLENFNTFSQIAHLDFDIPLPHILLPLALSFVTFQQIAFLFDCYKHAKGETNENLHIDFIDYALFISFFPQLIAGPIVHHREMMPQFASMGNSSLGNHCRDLQDFESSQANQPSSPPKSCKNSTINTANTRIVDSSKSNNSSLRDLLVSPASAIADSWQSKNFPSLAESIPLPKSLPQGEGLSCDSPSLAEGARGWVKSTINYEYLAKGIFIFSIGLFKKVFIADSFAKWANAGFSIVEKGGHLNILESWATSLSYTFQLYFDFSGYCDMAIGLALMFGIILPLNFNSPYKSLNIAEFWRRWHITLGRFLRECLYIPLGGNRGKGNSSKKYKQYCHTEPLGEVSHTSNNANRDISAFSKPQYDNLYKTNITTKILTLRNLFIVAFLSGIWHGAGWGFVIWGILHGIAMVVHRIYVWWLGGNLFWGNHLRCFGAKLRSMNALVLSLLFRTKTAQSTTAITSIVSNTKSAESSLRDLEVKSWQSKSNCHLKRSEVSQNRDSSLTSLPQNDNVANSRNDANNDKRGSILREFRGLCSHERGHKTKVSMDEVSGKLLRKSPRDNALYKFLCWFITFNFVNIAWIFFRAENLSGAVNLLKGMFGIESSQIPHKWSRIFGEIHAQTNEIIIWIICALIVCVVAKNSFEILQSFDTKILRFTLSVRLFGKNIWLSGGAVFTRFVLALALFYASMYILLKNVLDSNAYVPFLYFNF